MHTLNKPPCNMSWHLKTSKGFFLIYIIWLSLIAIEIGWQIQNNTLGNWSSCEGLFVPLKFLPFGLKNTFVEFKKVMDQMLLKILKLDSRRSLAQMTSLASLSTLSSTSSSTSHF